MSQAGIINTQSGPVPPTVATSYITQDGTAVPAANTLVINGNQSIENNANGIISKGGIVGTGTSNEVDLVLTNRATGTRTTADATPSTLVSFPLGSTPGVYYFTGSIVAYDITDTAGGAYSFVAGARTTGAAGINLGTEINDILVESALSTASFTAAISGNNLVVTITGIIGKTIDWNCLINYIFVS